MSCNVRLLSEFGGSSSATLSAGTGTSVTAPSGTASSYVSWDCVTPPSVTVSTHDAVPVPGLNATRGDAFSILVYQQGEGVAVAGFKDATAALADVSDNIDTVTVRVVNARGTSVGVFGVADECWQCKLPSLVTGGVASGAAAPAFRVSSAYGLTFRTDDGVTSTTTTLGPFDELGAYTVVVHADAGLAPSLLADAPGRDAYLPILFAALILAGLALVHRVLVCAVKRSASKGPRVRGKVLDGDRRRAVNFSSFFALDTAADEARAAAAAHHRDDDGADDDIGEGFLSLQHGGAGGDSTAAAVDGDSTTTGKGSDAERTRPLSSQRVLSLDTFRGFALCIMMFVNSGGGAYTFFDHARWNGLTVADLVFPWFVFMSGVSAAMSFASERKRGATRSAMVSRVVTRSVKLYLLNALVNNDTDFSKVRAYGVLFYFAISYLIIGCVDALLPPDTSRAGDAPIPSQSLIASLYLDFGRYYKQWAVMLSLWAVYCSLQFLLPVPGCPTGYIGPGGLADGGQFSKCTGGAHKYIDDMVVGVQHYYGGPTCSGDGGVYECGAYDPEGLLGGLSAAWMAWLGLTAGRIFIRQRALRAGGGASLSSSSPESSAAALAKATTVRWTAIGLLLCLLAGILCGFKKEGGWIPVNKNLWSPSFVLLLAGFGHLALSALYWIVDVWRAWDGTPFRFVGQNSLAVYLTSELLSNQVPLRLYWHEDGPNNHAEALLRDLTCVVVLLALARMWHLQGFFWSV